MPTLEETPNTAFTHLKSARTQKMSNDCFIGVDVGTGSVRAGLVSHDGRVLKTHSEDLEVGQTDEMSAFS